MRVPEYYVKKIKHYLRQENKTNENEILLEFISDLL